MPKCSVACLASLYQTTSRTVAVDFYTVSVSLAFIKP